MLVTEKLCDAEVDGSVSVDPDIVVREPFGSVDVVGGMTLIEGLKELLKVGDEDNDWIEPEIVVREPFGSVDTVGGTLVNDKFPVGELVLLNGFVFVPDIKLLLNGFVFVPEIKLLTEVDVLDEDAGWIEVELDEEIEFVGDVEMANTEVDGDAEFEEEDELLRGVEETLAGVVFL